jgi:hypothetical protein
VTGPAFAPSEMPSHATAIPQDTAPLQPPPASASELSIDELRTQERIT